MSQKKFSSDRLLNALMSERKKHKHITAVSPSKATLAAASNAHAKSVEWELDLAGVDYSTQRAIRDNLQALHDLVPAVPNQSPSRQDQQAIGHSQGSGQ